VIRDLSTSIPSTVGHTEFKPLLSSQSTFGRKFRVMYILKNYPQMSETYIKTEIEAVHEVCDVGIVATKRANMPAKNHEPYRYIEDPAMICEAIEEFQPDVLHSHWFHSVKLLGKLARKTGVPFTVRGHSFDSIWPEDESRFRHAPGRPKEAAPRPAPRGRGTSARSGQAAISGVSALTPATHPISYAEGWTRSGFGTAFWGPTKSRPWLPVRRQRF